MKKSEIILYVVNISRPICFYMVLNLTPWCKKFSKI